MVVMERLVIGINAYSYENLNNLKAPAQDAEAVAQLLEKYGDFKVRRLPAVKDKENNTIKLGQKTKVNLNQLEESISLSEEISTENSSDLESMSEDELAQLLEAEINAAKDRDNSE